MCGTHVLRNVARYPFCPHEARDLGRLTGVLYEWKKKKKNLEEEVRGNGGKREADREQKEKQWSCFH